MKGIIKVIAILVLLMALLAVVTTFFRVVMAPDGPPPKTDAEAREQALDPLKSIGEEPDYWLFPGSENWGSMAGFGKVFVDKMIVAWFVILVLLIFSFLATRKVSVDRPSRVQVAFEWIIGFFNEICKDTMGEKGGRKIFPLVMTLFLFIILSNYMGIIPALFQFFATVTAMILSIFDKSIVWITSNSFPSYVIQLPHGHWLEWFAAMPKLEEPTADLNTTLGCGLIVITYVHFKGIQAKGIWGYIKSYFHPVFFFAPMNLIGELAKGVSLSFRLFGNILGGSVVFLVLMNLLYSAGTIFLPQTLGIYMVLQGFLSLLVGAVQAFVFAMLALTYTAVMVEE